MCEGKGNAVKEKSGDGSGPEPKQHGSLGEVMAKGRTEGMAHSTLTCLPKRTICSIGGVESAGGKGGGTGGYVE